MPDQPLDGAGTEVDPNDIEAIIAVVNTDVGAVEHAVADHAEAIFTWDYEKGARPARPLTALVG